MLRSRRALMCSMIVLCAAVLAFAAKIKADFDKTATFAGYKTYAWGKNLEPQRPGANIVLAGAVDYELQERGLRQQDIEHADLIVRYEVAGDTDMAFSMASDPTYAAIGGIPWAGATMWYPGFNMPSSGRYIRKGSVVIDIFDRQQRKLIWTAMAIGALDSRPSKAIDQINKTVEAMFAQYPVKARS